MISHRFDEDIVTILLKLQWWDRGDEFIKQNIELFMPDTDITKNPEYVARLSELSKKWE